MLYTTGERDYREAWGVNGESRQSMSNNSIPAFFNLEDHEDEEEVSEWMENAISVLQSQMATYTRKAVENLAFYKGVQLDPQNDYYTLEDATRFVEDNRISMNIVYEFVETWVNRIGKFKAELEVDPSTNDSDARENAEAKAVALRHFFEKNKVNALLTKRDREAFQFGEGYIYAYWDQNRGPLRPGFEDVKKRFQKMSRIATPSGDEVNIQRFPRVGDVALRVVPSIYVYFEDRDWEALDYIIIELKGNADKLRSSFPNIEIDGDGDISDYHMYHLPTEYLPEGRFVRMASGQILENTKFPYPKPIFPVTRMTNIDVTGASRGKSFIENIKSPQILINETISEVWRNLRRSAKGKWVLPAKTANPRHLAPESPAIEYFGNIAPKYTTYEGIKREAIDFIMLLREYAEKQARIHGIVQGTPPPNVRSGVQFAQLEEKEEESVGDPVDKKNASTEELGEIVAMIMSVRYREEDGRTVTIFGRDKEYLTKALNIGALKEDHPVKVRRKDAGLPMGKVSQAAFFKEMKDSFGEEVIPNEMMIDMFDSGRYNEYTEFVGATVETTNAQMNMAIQGKMPPPPEEYEDLILKWKIIVGTMRKRTFLTYSKEVKDIFKTMVETIENLIINKQNPSPAFQQRLQMLQAFPIYYRPPVIQFQEDMPMPMPGGPEAEMADPAAEQAAMEEMAMMEGDIPDGQEEIPPELLSGEMAQPI